MNNHNVSWLINQKIINIPIQSLDFIHYCASWWWWFNQRRVVFQTRVKSLLSLHSLAIYMSVVSVSLSATDLLTALCSERLVWCKPGIRPVVEASHRCFLLRLEVHRKLFPTACANNAACIDSYNNDKWMESGITVRRFWRSQIDWQALCCHWFAIGTVLFRFKLSNSAERLGGVVGFKKLVKLAEMWKWKVFVRFSTAAIWHPVCVSVYACVCVC